MASSTLFHAAAFVRSAASESSSGLLKITRRNVRVIIKIKDDIFPVLLKSFEMLGETARLIEYVGTYSEGSWAVVPGCTILFVQVLGDDVCTKLLVCRALEREMNLQSEDAPTIYQCVLSSGFSEPPMTVWDAHPLKV